MEIKKTILKVNKWNLKANHDQIKTFYVVTNYLNRLKQYGNIN